MYTKITRRRSDAVEADTKRLPGIVLRMVIVATLTGAGGIAGAGAQDIAALKGAVGSVYTADEHGNTLSVVDLASGQVRTHAVPISPHNAQVTADGARVLVVGEPAAAGHAHAPGAHGGKAEVGRLLVYDTRHLGSGALASIAVGGHPAHVVADRAGRLAFVTLAEANAVAVVDLSRKQVVRRVATGRYPHGLRISPDGREAYVANVEDGSVSVIDIAAGSEAARIPVGQAPVQVGFTPDGSRVYVSLRDENSVAVIDTAARAVQARIAVGSKPIQVHATLDGRFVYVANQGTEAKPADTVSVIEVATGTVIDTIRTGAGAHGVAVSDDGRLVFVTNIVDGTLSVIDAASRTVVTTFSVGKGPNGVTYRPGPG